MKHFWTKVALPLSLTYKLNVFFSTVWNLSRWNKGNRLVCTPSWLLRHVSQVLFERVAEGTYIHTDIHACMHVYIIKPPIKPYKSSLLNWDYWLITDYIVSSGSTNELYICLSTHRQVMVAALSVRYAESTLLKFSQVHHWSQLAMKY